MASVFFNYSNNLSIYFPALIIFAADAKSDLSNFSTFNPLPKLSLTSKSLIPKALCLDLGLNVLIILIAKKTLNQTFFTLIYLTLDIRQTVSHAVKGDIYTTWTKFHLPPSDEYNFHSYLITDIDNNSTFSSKLS